MVASLFDKKANRSSFGIEVLRAGAHAGISGTSSALQGGSFYQGALTGALSSSFSSAASAVGGTEGDMAGVFGGAVGSALNGDNFMKSFVRGFSIGMFNHGLHEIFSDPIYPPKDKCLEGFPDAEYQGKKGYSL